MWWKKSEDDAIPRCSFGAKSQDEVERFIRSPNGLPRVFICNECVELVHQILQDERARKPEPDSGSG